MNTFIKTFLISLLTALLTACSEKKGVDGKTEVNPRDTVTVPDYLTGEDSIAYIENTLLKSPLSVDDFLGLAEVHSVEANLAYYNDFDRAREHPEYADCYLASHRDSCAMRLANRFMRSAHLVNENGDANDKLQWVLAVHTMLETFCLKVPSLGEDSALYEIIRVTDKFSSQTQYEMNFQCYVSATVEYFRTIEAYLMWLSEIPKNLQPLMQEEYEAWHDLNDARFRLWNEVSYVQDWYSMKPMEIEGYYENLATSRRKALEQERLIILYGKPYHQKGKSVTTEDWNRWMAQSSVPEDADLLKELGHEERLPSDSLVAERVGALKSTFTRWLTARQAIAAALPKESSRYYDNMTADIHCQIIGGLEETEEIK